MVNVMRKLGHRPLSDKGIQSCLCWLNANDLMPISTLVVGDPGGFQQAGFKMMG